MRRDGWILGCYKKKRFPANHSVSVTRGDLLAFAQYNTADFFGNPRSPENVGLRDTYPTYAFNQNKRYM
jgi:hypothetical protein